MCSAWVNELHSTPMDQVQRVPAWGALRDHLVVLRQATLGLSPRPNLSAPEDFATWFPSVFTEGPINSPSDSVRTPSVPRTPPRPPAPVDASPVRALSSTMSKLEACVFSIQETISGLAGAWGRGVLRPRGPSGGDQLPPPSKRARLSSPSRRDWFTPSAAPPSGAASTYGDVGEGSGSGDDVSVAGAVGLPPSASLGWEGMPDGWAVHPVGNELVGYCLEDDGKTFEPLSQLEFRVHSVGGAL